MPKNCQKWPKMAFFRINQRLSPKRAKISKKRPCYVSYIFYPQLRAGFRKNPRSGFWDNPCRSDRHTHTAQYWFYRSLSVFNRGPKTALTDRGSFEFFLLGMHFLVFILHYKHFSLKKNFKTFFFSTSILTSIFSVWRQFWRQLWPKIPEIWNFPRRNDYPIF